MTYVTRFNFRGAGSGWSLGTRLVPDYLKCINEKHFNIGSKSRFSSPQLSPTNCTSGVNLFGGIVL